MIDPESAVLGSKDPFAASSPEAYGPWPPDGNGLRYQSRMLPESVQLRGITTQSANRVIEQQ
jgi:hypothetical protein